MPVSVLLMSAGIGMMFLAIMLLLGRMLPFSRSLVSWGTPIPLLLTLVALLLWREEMVPSLWDTELITVILAVCGGIMAILCAFFVCRAAYAGVALLGIFGSCAAGLRMAMVGDASTGCLIGCGCYILTLAFGCMGMTMPKSVRADDKRRKGEKDSMEISDKNLKRILWTVTEGLLAFLLCVTPMMSIGAYSYTYNISYLTLIGSILSIGSVTGLSMLGEDGVGVFVFYCVIITAIIVCCVVMAVNAWKGRGRIFYLIGNALAFVLVICVLVAVRAWTNNGLFGDTSLLRMGVGYWFALFLSLIGFAFGVMNFLDKSGDARYAGVPVRVKMPWSGFADRKDDKETEMSGTGTTPRREEEALLRRGSTRRREEEGLSGRGSMRRREEEVEEERIYRTYRAPDSEYAAERHVKKPVWEDAPGGSTMYYSAESKSYASGYRADREGYRTDGGASYSDTVSGGVPYSDPAFSGGGYSGTVSGGETGMTAEENEPSVKVKYNIRNHGETRSGSDKGGSEFFYRDEDDLS